MEKTLQKWFIWGIVFICLGGTSLHFAFDLFKKMYVIGLFSPVNESVWEHLKIVFYPTVIWFMILYFTLNLDIKKLLISLTISILVSTFTILAIYYIYTGAFGKQSVVIDIIAYLIGTSLGQYIALHAYINLKDKLIYIIIAVIFLFLFLFALIYFTFNPPHLPLFFDYNTKKYGI